MSQCELGKAKEKVLMTKKMESEKGKQKQTERSVSQGKIHQYDLKSKRE